MRRTLPFVVLGLLLTLAASQAIPQQETPPQRKTPPPAEAKPQEGQVPQVTAEKPMSFWMEKKLEDSKAMLEALTKGDFEELSFVAKRMRLVGQIEGVVRRSNPDYNAQLRAFDMANLELIRQATRKSSEGAALAFNQLTNSCVGCHVILREGK